MVRRSRRRRLFWSVAAVDLWTTCLLYSLVLANGRWRGTKLELSHGELLDCPTEREEVVRHCATLQRCWMRVLSSCVLLFLLTILVVFQKRGGRPCSVATKRLASFYVVVDDTKSRYLPMKPERERVVSWFGVTWHKSKVFVPNGSPPQRPPLEFSKFLSSLSKFGTNVIYPVRRPFLEINYQRNGAQNPVRVMVKPSQSCEVKSTLFCKVPYFYTILYLTSTSRSKVTISLDHYFTTRSTLLFSFCVIAKYIIKVPPTLHHVIK